VTLPHEHRLHVRYSETDQMGVVYHANYLVYMDEARTRLLADRGLPYAEVERGGHALVVRRADVRYRAGARYGDEIVITTRVAEIRNASVSFEYELHRGSDGTLLATGSTELCCVALHREGRPPTPLGDEMRAALRA
jgi:acyl-CoA thioester hydrolase